MLVLADRGLDAPGSVSPAWIKAGIHFCASDRRSEVCVQGSGRWEWIKGLLPAYGEQWTTGGRLAKTRPQRMDLRAVPSQAMRSRG